MCDKTGEQVTVKGAVLEIQKKFFIPVHMYEHAHTQLNLETKTR